MTLQDKLKAMLAETEKATPGPWRLHGCCVFLPEPYEDEWIGLRGPADEHGNDIRTHGGFTRALLTKDARFVSQSRTNYPAALRALLVAVEYIQSGCGHKGEHPVDCGFGRKIAEIEKLLEKK